MAVEYRFDHRSGACMRCGREFTGGETILTTIVPAEGESFARQDLCQACGTGADTPQPFSVWRSRHPEPAEDRHTLDYDLAVDFLAKLIEEQDPRRATLVYVLALLLGRKRRVKILRTRRVRDGEPGGGETGHVEELDLLLPRPEEDVSLSVPVPRLDAEGVAAVQGQIAELFGFATPAPEPDPVAEPVAGSDAASGAGSIAESVADPVDPKARD